ncbi:hypothetical protein FIBSPDRAFT_881591 [Athelia psychrophila]|uniref:Uncharacterized protein n=1 Tax=Athelia psychrophila TaxID=1759441 RepID=A0A166W550_9AGAM|nr:hypothetical protein FIBSPDRAFT_881591 [Fibularhizoctonia sp. CBS 109695]
MTTFPSALWSTTSMVPTQLHSAESPLEPTNQLCQEDKTVAASAPHYPRKCSSGPDGSHNIFGQMTPLHLSAYLETSNGSLERAPGALDMLAKILDTSGVTHRTEAYGSNVPLLSWP